MQAGTGQGKTVTASDQVGLAGRHPQKKKTGANLHLTRGETRMAQQIRGAFEG